MEILPSLDKIKKLRKKLDITQKELGKKLNIPQSTISRIENGTIDPPYSKIKKIYEYLENERKIKEKSKKHAEDIMTQNIISIKPSSTIKEAVELLNRYEISQLPIIQNHQNLGSLTSKKTQQYLIDNPELMNADVSIIKELPFPEVDKKWSIKDISNLLVRYPAVLVKDFNHKFIGIITDSDLLKIPNK
ncbi:MAG: CBS domain-containing protein [Promethearchaeota archaeon]